MLERKEHIDEPILGVERVVEYARKHEKTDELRFRAFLKKMRALGPKGRCLEAGAGIGTLACLFAREHPRVEVTAFDVSPDMVKLAREYIRDKGLADRIRYFRGDVNDGEEMKRLGKFDLVYSSFSLHHWRDPERSIKNLWNTLKDDGILYIYDLRRVWWLYLLPGNGGFISSIRASYRPREIAEILNNVGIKRYRIEASFPYFIQSIIAWK